MKNVFKTVIAASALILVGQGCTPLAPTQDLPTEPPAMMEGEKKPEGDAVMEDEPKDGAMMEGDRAAGDDTMMKADLAPYYLAYTETQAAAAMKEGRATVLYFYAAWCPICRTEDPKIKSWIETSELPIAGFRVNYDTESSLKSKYKIPYQHTTVFLNAAGEETGRFNGPVTETEFRAALAKAAGK